MRLHSIGLLALVAAVVAGCGASETPQRTTAAQGTPEATVAPAKPPKKAPAREDSDGNGIPDVMTIKGAVGDTLALEGSGLNDDVNDHTKTKVRIKLEGTRGPFKGYDIPGNRKLVGVVLRFTNT